MKYRTKAVDLRLILSGTSKCSAAQRFSQDLIQIYGQSAILGWFVRNQNEFYGQTGISQRFVRKFLAIMMMIYGQSQLFGVKS